MNVFPSIRSGLSRAAVSWKAILVTWFMSLMLAALIAVPLKAMLETGFGSSMITERFLNGINIETFTDMGMLFKGLLRSFGGGILILFLISFIANAFLAGGLFESVSSSKRLGFWKACAWNFWSFLLVQVVITIMIILVHSIMTGIPAIFLTFGEGHSEKTIFLVVLVSSIVFFLILPVFIIVADYARAWIVADENKGFFVAVGHGIRQTFRKLGSSWLLMLSLVIIQLIYLILCFIILSGMIPSTGGGVFLLLLISQVLFCGRIFMRVLRFGSVTALMEMNNSARENNTSF